MGNIFSITPWQLPRLAALRGRNAEVFSIWLNAGLSSRPSLLIWSPYGWPFSRTQAKTIICIACCSCCLSELKSACSLFIYLQISRKDVQCSENRNINVLLFLSSPSEKWQIFNAKILHNINLDKSLMTDLYAPPPQISSEIIIG